MACKSLRPGVYLLFRNGRLVYVGRSDFDVYRRLRNSLRHGTLAYNGTIIVYETSSAREAYRLECRLIHRHRPCDNSIHPAVPAGANWRCPVKTCAWS